LRDSVPIDMLLSAVSFLVVAQSSSELPEGLMNNPVLRNTQTSLLYNASAHVQVMAYQAFFL